MAGHRGVSLELPRHPSPPPGSGHSTIPRHAARRRHADARRAGALSTSGTSSSFATRGARVAAAPPHLVGHRNRVAISVFPHELYQAPRSWAERAHPHNLIHFNKVDRGGHFAAWEHPQLLAQELGPPSGPCTDRSAHAQPPPPPRARRPWCWCTAPSPTPPAGAASSSDSRQPASRSPPRPIRCAAWPPTPPPPPASSPSSRVRSGVRDLTVRWVGGC